MAQCSLNTLIEEIAATKRITVEDVFALRRTIYGDDNSVSLEEAEALLRLNEKVDETVPAWQDFFPEALSDLVVHQIQPSGYVTQEHADWLIAEMSRDGHICTRSELDAILHILDKAKSSPRSLETFALETVKKAVISGEGVTRSGKDLKPGVISDAEVELLRSVLYAGAGCGGIAISRAEAEILFDINDATIEAENAPAWSELFAKAVANYLMALSGYQAPSREVALARENWLAKEGGFEGGMKGFFSSMFSGGVSGVREAMRDNTSAMAERNAQMTAEIAVNEVITEEEAEWLVHRIGRDGVLHENEKALLRFIKEESPNIHPLLHPLIEQAHS
ncbi:conserved hypothetical protein [Roseibium sp. TrichSKD4]|uniref:hypothetical protein n=1 Tax=Roseibium sp. TrichSKD4 TaxID=744980 RepID=UPI0001E5715C|nr:hypothetical protein [Roseibium sp. TrichSKD4]EFO28968.1 conserved hypothetical protein [Roseibium sp. TrichSKD4]